MSPVKMNEIGPAGRNLIANVGRLRQERRMSLRGLSAAFTEAGRPILPIGLSRVETGQRRVDVDDLTVLARIFDVTPADLLAPPAAAAAPDHPAICEAENLTARIRQLLDADGDRALAGRQAARALRRVALEIEELLEEAPRAGTETR
jgi:transcriptional regulator with XRE-family HTH domain